MEHVPSQEKIGEQNDPNEVITPNEATPAMLIERINVLNKLLADQESKELG